MFIIQCNRCGNITTNNPTIFVPEKGTFACRENIKPYTLCNDCIKSFFNWIDSANLVNQDLEWETPHRKLDEDFVKEMYNREY